MAGRLFVAQFVVALEDQWFGPDGHGPAIRVERRHFVAAHLFTASDAETAYRMACDWLPGFEDVNHDGAGDLTREFAIGLHQLEEVIETLDEFPDALHQLYGVEVGAYDPADRDATGVPLVRGKHELEVFKHPGFRALRGRQRDG